MTKSAAVPADHTIPYPTMTWEYHQGHAAAPPSVTYLTIDITVS